MTVRSKENTCSANPKSARRARTQKPWSARRAGCVMAERRGADSLGKLKICAAEHRRRTDGAQTTHRQRTDNAQTTHRQRTEVE